MRSIELGQSTLREQKKRLLLIGGSLTASVSLMHVGMILGGASWYRFFGAGEAMARLDSRGSLYPNIVTAAIAAILAVWALYAFSGAGVIRRLPFLRPALVVIATIFLARGVLAIPAVLIIDTPYMQELRTRMTFMVVTSLISLGLGICYASGAAAMTKQRSSTTRD